jgi:hypothetical protein
MDNGRGRAHSRDMKALRCYLGRHSWRHEINPEMGGPDAGYDVCSRCGKERNAYEKNDGTGIGAIGGVGG